MSTLPRRESGRLIVIDETDRVLLFHGAIRESPPRMVWYTPGGRLEPGESYEDAARRELFEETGYRCDELGPCVWVRRAVRRLAGGEVDARARFSLVRTPRFDVDLTNIGASEDLVTWRWWSLDEIRREPADQFIPRHLGTLLEPLLAGVIPDDPIDASDR